MPTDLPGRLKLEVPVLQAPLGGNISSPELAAAVSNAGGLGSIGMRAPKSILRDLAHARALAPGRPLALGLLVPFTVRPHVDAVLASRPDAVVLMDGFAPKLVARLRDAGLFVIHQVGSRVAAERALREGADALIAQGVEAGGHVLGDEPGSSLLDQVLEVAGHKPVLLAGGIATSDDVRAALARGAASAVAGTRYLLTHEAWAHPAYKQRVLGAERTLLTTLFGFGWTLKHRVVPNLATERFCDAQGRIAPWIGWVNRSAEPLARRFGVLRDPSVGRTRTSHRLPFFLPSTLHPGQLASGVEYAALYAGQSASRIHSIESAFDVTRQLAPGTADVKRCSGITD
jgi:nitronate monooxygenase